MKNKIFKLFDEKSLTEFLEFFKDVPNDISDIYITPNYHSFSYNFKTAVSPKIVEQIFNAND